LGIEPAEIMPVTMINAVQAQQEIIDETTINQG